MTAQVNAVLRQVPHSYLVAVSALMLALGLHAVPVLQKQPKVVELAGGNTALAGEGNSFVNLAIGVETPIEADVPEQTLQADPLPPVQPQAVAPAEQPLAQQPVAEVLNPVAQIEAVQGGVPLVVVSPERSSLTPTMDPTVVPVSQPAADAATEVATELAETAKPAEPAVLPEPSPAPVLETTDLQESAVHAEPIEVQPPEPQSPAVTHSLRPPERPVEPPVQPEPEPAAQRVEKPAVKPAPTAKPRGNSEASATQGEVNATRNAPGGQASNTGGRAKVQGNAAVSNYPGLVMRRIQRAKRRANVRGVAVVRFRVTAGGGLSGLSIARSSGSAKLDGIALAQVRRAAPFPPPPSGARTSFTVRIKGN
ncbi:TonB family protein [Pseudophaeobacter sp.]|uniref:energy transducer TonB family protein n=1 Tax=Pseudophaeobacter sp. TaxID=1971739 RepID=UPI0032989E29